MGEIIDTPLQIVAFYVESTANSPTPTPHPLGGTGQAALTRGALLSELDSDTQNELDEALSNSIKGKFDTAWAGYSATINTQITAAIKERRPDAYQISVNVPQSGQLSAAVGTAWINFFIPDPSSKLLTLTYAVPLSATFKVDSGFFFIPNPTINWAANGQLVITVVVPKIITPEVHIPNIQTTLFTTSTNFMAANMNIAPSGLLSTIVFSLDVVFKTISFQTPPATQLGDKTIPQTIPEVQELFDKLASGFLLARDFGFVRLDVQLNDDVYGNVWKGKMIEFDVTHDLSVGPVLIEEFQHTAASLLVSPGKVNAGKSVAVSGRFFPFPTANSLALSWTYPGPGLESESELEFGIAGPGRTPPQSTTKVEHISRTPTPSFSWAPFQLKPLLANTTYGIRVRNFDIPNFIAGAWSPWVFLTTAASDNVTIVLQDGTGAVQKAVPLQEDGTFLTTLDIPSNETPGTYQIQGTAYSSSASAPLTVVAVNTPIDPELHIVDLAGNVINNPSVYEGNSFVIQGLHFAQGPVQVWIDTVGQNAVLSGPIVADPSGTFKVEATKPSSSILGAHTIIAVQGALQASTGVDFALIR